MELKKATTMFILIYCMALNTALAEIRNGYESEIKGMRASLKRLTEVLRNPDSNLTFIKRSTMKSNIHKLEEFIAYFELTEKLIEQFRSVAPELYKQIDTLSDRTGQPVTVYVKFVSQNEMQLGADGTTNIDQSNVDKTAYQSEYGLRTVSVKIASVSRALFLLAHEFGHVKYQVSNLDEYVDYYRLHYQNEYFNSGYVGHNSSDRSGHTAMEFENLFRKQYFGYTRTTSDEIENPLALLHGIRKHL